jgi:hypothetical protein
VTGAAAARARLRQGGIAGVYAGGTAAPPISILTVTTMLLLPRHVDLERDNPDPNVHAAIARVRRTVLVHELGRRTAARH